MENPSETSLVNVCCELEEHLLSKGWNLSGINISQGLRKYDGGKHTRARYYVYDPFSNLVDIPIVSERKWS